MLIAKLKDRPPESEPPDCVLCDPKSLDYLDRPNATMRRS